MDNSGTGPVGNALPEGSVETTQMVSLLSEVDCDEDKQLIMDVLHAIKMCRSPDTLCTSWTVTPSSTGYILVAYLPRYSIGMYTFCTYFGNIAW